MAEDKTAVAEQEMDKTKEVLEEKVVDLAPESQTEEPPVEESPAEETLAEEIEQSTAEAPVTEEAPVEQGEEPALTVEKSEEKTEEQPEPTPEQAPEEKAQEKTEEKTEKAEPTPMVCLYKTAIANYTDAQALNFLRKKIYGYQEIDEEFLKKVAEDGAFKTEMKYISVVRCASETAYSWKTGKGEELHEHNETKSLSKDFCDDVVELNPFDFGTAKTIDLETPREDDKMLAKKSYSVAKAKKDFNVVIKNASPHKSAKYVKMTERYETVYVPVLKTSCVFEGETYLGYVNLLNGACVSEYKVSDRLQTAVNAAMGRAKWAKGALVHSLVFLLLLCVMSLGKAIYRGMSALNVPVLWVGVIMGAAAIVPIFCLGVTAKYKPDKMKERAVHTGKMPTAKGAKWLAILSWLTCAAAVVVFFLKTVL